MMRMIWALIPAYNAGATLERVIEETLRYVDKVCVVDDGSEDLTGNVLRRLKDVFPTRLIYLSNSQNLGKLESVKKGLREVLKDPKAELIISLDADLSHSPHEIPSIIAIRENYDMVIGNRYFSRELDEHRKSVVMAISMFVKEVTGYELNDPLCGFRLFTRRLGKIFVENLSTHGYGLEIEELILSKLFKANIGQYNLKYVVKQQPFTKAVEFIDIFKTINFYSEKILIPKQIKDKLPAIISSLEKRETFSLDVTLCGKICSLFFNYVPLKDSYSVSLKIL
jgi:glycosyltransferase involved in cell wall biosynthesis